MILQEIKNLDENSTKEDIMALVKTDFKKFSSKNPYVIEITNERPILKYKDSLLSSNIDKYFKYRRVDSLIEKKYESDPNKYKELFDCDKCTEILEIYKELKWIDTIQKEKFILSDTINSFATTYLSGLAIYYDNEYRINDKNEIRLIEGNRYASSKQAPYFYKKNFPKLNKLDYMEEFACLTHSFGNFMPSLYKEYNKSKGTEQDIKDYIDLMLQYIKNNNSEYFSKDLFEKLCLEDYIDLDSLEIKPLFKRSNNNALPTTKSELEECVLEMNKRIKTRALRIIMRINQNEKVKQMCNELIKKISLDD